MSRSNADVLKDVVREVAEAASAAMAEYRPEVGKGHPSNKIDIDCDVA